jgi:hypothetical protein
METSAARAGKNNAARVVGNLRRDLVGEVDTQVPEFAQARNAFSTRQKMIDALTEGRRVFDRGIAPDELASTLNGMTAGERDMFQHGARMALADAQKDSAGAATRILEKNWNKAKLAQVVGPSLDPFSGQGSAILCPFATRARRFRLHAHSDAKRMTRALRKSTADLDY